jgi:polysaccharide biosynthesis protein PslF
MAADGSRLQRLVFVAPRSVDSGVGDHADRLLEALRPHADEVVELRCGGAGDDSVWDCIRLRRQLTRALRGGEPRGTVVHAELSGGSVAPFWAIAGRSDVVCTAMVHDPPRPVWMIFRFRLIAKSRLLDNAVHRLLNRWIEAIERRALRHVGLVGTSTRGSRGLAERGFGREVKNARLLPLAYPSLPPLSSRPLAVGLFGYHYRGKGFEFLD